MGFSVSETSICNSALIKVGSPRIADISEQSKSGILCQEQYSKLRDQVMAAHPWNFAIKRASLALLPNAPLFDYSNAFRLPDDCLRVLRVSDPLLEFKIEGTQLLCDSSVVLIRYISQVTDPTQFEPSFLTALEFRLAAELAYGLTQNATLAQTLYQAYVKELAEARSTNSQGGGTPDAVWAEDWLLRRF